MLLRRIILSVVCFFTNDTLNKSARRHGSSIASPAEATAGQKWGGNGKNPLKEQIRQGTADRKLAVTRQTVARWIETSGAAIVATGAPHPQSLSLIHI